MESIEVYSVMNERIKVVTRYYWNDRPLSILGRGFFYCVRKNEGGMGRQYRL